MRTFQNFIPAHAIVILLVAAQTGHAEEAKPEARSIAVSLAEGKLELTSPETWTPKEPKFRGIVDYEFAVASEGEARPGRVTVGGLSGGNEANKRRWLAQFRQPKGEGRTEDVVKSEKKKLAGTEIEVIDITGTYINPPFSGGGTFEGYRMLAAVIDADKLGTYYVKFYGPARTVAANEKAFAAMIDSLKQK